MSPYRLLLIWALLQGCHLLTSAQGITSIVTANESGTATTHTSMPGAGHRNAAGVLSSLWDSAGTSFTIRYGVGPVQRTTIQQFNVSGFSGAFISAGGVPIVKVRRSVSQYVGASTVFFNMWMVYDTVPPSGSTGGTFLLKAPQPASDAALLSSGNLLAGLDNVFQNTVQNLHSGNIERLDIILSQGLTPVAADITRAGMAVFDRGAGDSFKIAAVLAINAGNDPTAFGPLVTVAAAQFGPNLLTASQTMIIATQDNRIQSRPRPSSISTQNIRGTLVPLGTMGLSAGQTFYGYSLFPMDVTTAQTDWTTQPTNSNSGNQIDPVAFFGVFKEVGATLAVRSPVAGRNRTTAMAPRAWPNPAASYLEVAGFPLRSRLQLFNAAGSLLEAWPLPAGKGRFEVGHLPGGLYHLQHANGIALRWVKE